MSPVEIGVISLIVLFLIMFLGVPIGLSMGLVGFVGVWYLSGSNAALNVVGMIPFSTSINYSLSVFPLFLLMGNLVATTGISADLFYTANKWLGHLPGGLAIATVGACTGFAAICGDAITGSATMASVALPEMRKYKYSAALASGCIAAGGTMGILIPPSLIFIIYGMLTQQSIGKLFIAGIAPGIMLAVLFTATILVISRVRPKDAPRGPKATFKEQVVSLKGVWAAGVLFIVVIGGIYAGFFTTTEAGAFGALGAFIVALSRRRLSKANTILALRDTVKLVAVVFMMLIGAMIYSVFLATTKIPANLTSMLMGTGLPPAAIMALIILLFVVLGCVIDSLAMILLFIPVIFPLVKALGFDPIWFGVIAVLIMQQAMMTPPVGMSCFVVKGVAKDIPLSTIFKGVMPFWAATLVCIFILLFVPQVVTTLPNLMK